MRLRSYQNDCVSSAMRSFDNNDSVLVVMATGLGKTIVFSHICAHWPGRVLVIAHRDELITQAAEKIHQVSGSQVGIEKGEQRVEESMYSAKPKVVVASVQTMSRENRLKKFGPEEFGLIVCDEAHHSPGSSYQKVFSYFRQQKPAKLLGVTATPMRHDEVAMGQVYDDVAFNMGIEAAIQEGWLVPVKQQVVKIEGLDFSQVRTMVGDFNEAELERILTEETMLHKIAAPTVEIAGARPTLVFCVSVNHAVLMAEILNRYKANSAKVVHGDTPIDERRAIIEAYKAGQIQFLTNCGVFLEGFDAPTTACIAMGRPTKSLPLYTQVLGRGTRPLPGVVDAHELADARRQAIALSGKPSMTILDFAGNAGRHKIIDASDLLGGKWELPIRQYARKTAEEEGSEMEVDEAHRRAEAEMAFEEEEDQRVAALKKVKAKAEYRTYGVNPFGRGGSAPEADNSGGDGITPKQLWKLGSLGFPKEKAQTLTKRQASGIIGRLLAEQGG